MKEFNTSWELFDYLRDNNYPYIECEVMKVRNKYIEVNSSEPIDRHSRRCISAGEPGEYCLCDGKVQYTVYGLYKYRDLY